MARWRIKARLLFPTRVEGGPADGLKELSRIPDQTRDFANVPVRVEPIETPRGENSQFGWSWAEITVEVEGTDREAAVEACTEPLEEAIETLSFQIQAPLQFRTFAVIDAAAEDAGQPAEFRQAVGAFPFPLRRFRPAPTEIATVTTNLIPDLTLSVATMSPSHRLSLDWYLKALATPFEMDQFIFLWIAMENLWRMNVPLDVSRGPKKGSRIRRFLVDSFGVDHATAKRLWTARQVVHGEVTFNSEAVDELTQHVRVLRGGVNAHIKAALGLEESDPPIFHAPALSIASMEFVMTTTPEDPPSSD